MRRRTIVLLAALGTTVAAVPVVTYGVVAWTNRDTPDPAALGAAPDDAESATGGPASAEGTWVVADVDTNFVGYRIRERLGPVAAPSDAVGRTEQVEGTAALADGQLTALEVTVDMATLDSGSPSRDEFVRDDALDVGDFPVGELHLADPVDIEPPGDPHDVVEVTVPAELTLRGETREVDFDVQARWNGPTIQAAGSTTISRSDFGIDVSSRGGFSIAEAGTIEFELTFTPEGAGIGTPPPTLVDNPVTVTDEGEYRPPCQSDGTAPPSLDPPVLVTGSVPDADTIDVELVAGAQQITPVQTSTGLTGGAAWSPDGSQIVFSSSPSPEDPRTLAVIGSGGGTPTPVPGLSDVTHPDWGPDGTIVFVQHTDDEDESEIWAVEPDGSDAHVLVETPGIDTDPRWSPDGESVVFVTTNAHGTQDVLVAGADGRGLRTLVGDSDNYQYAPSFTPDGESVLFVRDGSIYRIGADGTGERQLTDGPSDTNPAMSPDGTRLAFLREGSLFVAAADGSQPACVVTNQAIGGGPRWRP